MVSTDLYCSQWATLFSLLQINVDLISSISSHLFLFMQKKLTLNAQLNAEAVKIRSDWFNKGLVSYDVSPWWLYYRLTSASVWWKLVTIQLLFYTHELY